MVADYEKILVPLDGSQLAELALKDAFSIAALSEAEIVLLQVIRPVESVIGADTAYPVFLDQQWQNQKIAALQYLRDVCEKMDCQDVKVKTAVEMGPDAETIIDYARHHDIDLIVMATHGRSGLKRWVYGSVADKVLRGADVPVLLIRAHARSEKVVE